MMPITCIHKGARYTVAAWGVDGDCAYSDFLAALRAHGNSDAAKVVVAVRMLAEAGPPRQKEKGHELHGAECKKLYELKPGGTRVVWFFGKAGTIIITHAFPKKGAKVSRECAQASSIMEAYWQEVSNART